MKCFFIHVFKWICCFSICIGTGMQVNTIFGNDNTECETPDSKESYLSDVECPAKDIEETVLASPSSVLWELVSAADCFILANIDVFTQYTSEPPGYIMIDRIPFQTLQDEERKQPASLYVRMKWDANQYFADQPQTIQLCKAIEEGSVEKVDQAIADGADVNAMGLDHMTPLMWAFPSSFEVFEHLLRKGANPNVAYSGRYNFHSFLDTPPFTRNFAVVGEAQYAVTPFSFFRIEKGMSSLNVAEECADSRWLKAILENGGDPNAGTKSKTFCPAGRAAIFRRRYDKLPLLCEAELDARGVSNSNGYTWTQIMFLLLFMRGYNADILIDLLNRIPDWQNDPIIAEAVTTFLVRDPDNTLYIPEDESEFMPSEELLQYLNLNEEERARMIAGCKRNYVKATAFRKAMLDYFDTQGLDVEKAKQQVKQEFLRIDKHEKMDPEKEKRMQYYRSLPKLDVLPRLPNRTLTGKQGTP